MLEVKSIISGLLTGEASSLPESLYRFQTLWRDLVLCQEKVQIKCNQFSLFLTKSNLLFLLHSPRCFQDIVPHIHLETNIHNDCEYALYCKMFRCTQKSVYMHVHN